MLQSRNMFKISGSVNLAHTKIIPSYNRYFQVKEQDNKTRDQESEKKERREKKEKSTKWKMKSGKIAT